MNPVIKERLFAALRSENQEKLMELINFVNFSRANKETEGHDLLLVALEYNHSAAAKVFLLNGFEVNNKCETSITPLHYAAIYGDVEIAEMLLDRNAQIDVEDMNGRTSLQNAIEYYRIEMVKLLLNRKACVNASNRDGLTPLHVATKENYSEIVEALLNHGACTEVRNRDGLTPLHVAAKGNYARVVMILLNHGACVNASNTEGLTPLHVASQENYLNIVKMLLNHGACVSASNKDGLTPLDVASMENYSEVMEILLNQLSVSSKKNPSEIEEILLNYGVKTVTCCFLPLHMATKTARKTTVKILLKRGADVNAPNESGKTVLCCAVESGYSSIIEEILKFHPDLNNESNKSSLNHAIKRPEIKYKKIVENLLESGFCVGPEYINDHILLHSAVKYGYLTVVEDLLRHGADVNTRSTPNECHTLLHTATICLQEEVAELLINCGADVNAEDGHKKTPIFYAVENLHLKITKLLLANGANIETEDCIYLLNTAVNKKSIEIIEILLQCNFDINGRDKLRTASDYQEQTNRHSDITSAKYHPRKGIKPYMNYFGTYTPLHVSANRGCEVITGMLLKKGIKVNAGDTTALHIAASVGHTKIVKMLLENDAVVNCKACSGKTPLIYAASFGHREVVEHLIQSGAEVDLIDVNGKTALHAAASQGHAKIVKMLLENGATVNSKSRSDNTPLHFAAQCGDLEVVETLIQFGAEVNVIDVNGLTEFLIACHIRDKFIIAFLLQNGSDINIRGRCTALDLTLNIKNPVKSDMESSKIIVRQVAKLKTKNVFVDETYVETIWSVTDLKQHYVDCLKEIKEMMKRKMLNTNVSFYDFLAIKDVHQLAIYTENESIVEVFESTEYVKMFPIYADELESQFKKGQERQHLLKPSIRSFNFFFKYDLPHLLINKMFSYLSNLDLRNITKARCLYDISDES